MFRPDHVHLKHVGEDSFYGMLARGGRELFKDEDYAALYRPDFGRPSVPPSQLCVLLLLQTHDGVSDEEAIERTAFDLRWKVALGLDLEDKLCAKSTLQLFRAKLVVHERFGELFERSVEACRRAGLLKRRKLEVAIDTTEVLGRGAVKDTFNLISDQIRALVHAVCELKELEETALVAEHGLGRHFGSSFKGAVALDWSDADARRALVGQLVADARVALALGRAALRGFAKDSERARPVREACALLADLLQQDIDETPEDGGPAAIRRGVAKDRIVSTTDVDMRHGHKSQSQGFDGYKASIVAETEHGVILATDVCAGNAADREQAKELITAAAAVAEQPVARMIGDTAYGDVRTREDIGALGVEVVAKVPPVPRRKGCFSVEDFEIDTRRGVARCPAGKQSVRRDRLGGDQPRSVFVFSRDDCVACPLRERCTTSHNARYVSYSEVTRKQARWRRRFKSERLRRVYRRRIVVEHRIGRLKQLGIAQARYFGRVKVAFQVALAAAVANFTLAAASSPPFGRWVERVITWMRTVIALVVALQPGAARTVGPLEMATSRPGF
jgi:transposase